MSTALTTIDPNLPAFLRNDKFLAINQRLGAGLSAGAPPRISFRASRFRLISGDGEETMVTENGGTTLTVLILDANPQVSKFYYDKPYNPASTDEDAGPACFSEMGDAPSARSPRPQSRSCASCPHNAWGSKVTPGGAKVKACGDYKKIAVIPVNNLEGDAYVLGIPGASLKSWSALVKSTSGRGVPVTALVVQLGFDTAASHPKLTFTPVAMINEAQYAQVADLLGTDELSELVGMGDAPHAGPFALEQPAMSGVGYHQAQGSAGAPPPVMAGPVGTAPIAPPPGFHMPAHTQAAVAQAAHVAPAPQPVQPASAAPVEAPKKRRTRAAAAPQEAAQVPVQAAPPPPVVASQGVGSVATVAPTSPAMDSLLDQIMGGKK